MILRLSLELPEDRAFTHTIRLVSRTLLEDIQVLPIDIDDIETILDELCTNVIRHAESAEGRFRVVLEYHPDRAVIIVTDHGKGFSPEAVAPPGSERPEEGGGTRLGGFGLPLIRALSDRIEFRPADGAGTTVRAEKSLRYETPAAAAEAHEMDPR